LYKRLLARLLKAPPLLKLNVAKPEIEVHRKREVIEVSHSNLKGRLAGMIAEGFFDSPTTGSAAYVELRERRGFSTSKPNVYRELDLFAEMGFVTKEEGGYKAVAKYENQRSRKIVNSFRTDDVGVCRMNNQNERIKELLTRLWSEGSMSQIEFEELEKIVTEGLRALGSAEA
jgi:hypothetical protein